MVYDFRRQKAIKKRGKRKRKREQDGKQTTDDQEALWKKVFEIKKKPAEKLKQIKRLNKLIQESLAQLKITDLY